MNEGKKLKGGSCEGIGKSECWTGCIYFEKSEIKSVLKIFEVAGIFGVWEVINDKKVTFFQGFDTKRKAENYIKRYYKNLPA